MFKSKKNLIISNLTKPIIRKRTNLLFFYFFILYLCYLFILQYWHHLCVAADIGTSGVDRGYFGPWRICKESYYGRTKCGDSITRFHPVGKSLCVI